MRCGGWKKIVVKGTDSYVEKGRNLNLNCTRRKKYLSICTCFWDQPARIAHWSQSTCQNIHEKYNSLVYCTSWVLSSPPVYVALPIFFWRLLAPFTCAAPPSNHHKSCNHNTHFCSTAPHLNRTSWSHYTPKTSLLYLRWRPQLFPKHTGARAQSHNA